MNSRGTALARRLKDREHEIELDHRDRHREKEEIEELRQKLLQQDNIGDIEVEIKRRLEKDEEAIRKRLVDLTRTTSDESSEDSDNEDKSAKKSSATNGKQLTDTSTHATNTSNRNHFRSFILTLRMII